MTGTCKLYTHDVYTHDAYTHDVYTHDVYTILYCVYTTGSTPMSAVNGATARAAHCVLNLVGHMHVFLFKI